MSDEDRKRIEHEGKKYARWNNAGDIIENAMLTGFKAGAEMEHERLQKEIDKLKAQWFHDLIQLNLKP